MALLSMAFFNREEDNRVTIDGFDLNVKCYRMRGRRGIGDKVGTAYIETIR